MSQSPSPRFPGEYNNYQSKQDISDINITLKSLIEHLGLKVCPKCSQVSNNLINKSCNHKDSHCYAERCNNEIIYCSKCEKTYDYCEYHN